MKWISWKPALMSGIGLTLSLALMVTFKPASADELSPDETSVTPNTGQSDLLAQGGKREKSSGSGNRSGGKSQSPGSGNRSGGKAQSPGSGNRSGGKAQSPGSGNRSAGNRHGGIHAPVNSPSHQAGSRVKRQSTISRSPSFSHPNLRHQPNVGHQPRVNGPANTNRSRNNIRRGTHQNLNFSHSNVSGIQRGGTSGFRNNAQRGAWSHPGYRNSQYTNRQFSGNSFNYGNRNFRLGHNTYRPAYYRHSGYHGYWNNNRGFGNGYYGYGSGYGYGNYYGYRPLGWGLGGWGLGSLLYSSGYLGYSNPYYVSSGTTVYNYAQPIPVASDLVDNDVNSMDDVMNNAVAAFQQEDYNAALDIINKGIAQYPDDAVFHEFRALVLFARGDYQQAAATIHSVLAVGPGWDWTTLSSFYSDVDTYTAQLRALEAAPQDAATRFLLAYHYLCCGHPEAAAEQLQKVVQLKPHDHVAVDMLKMLKPAQPDPQQPTTLKSSSAASQTSGKPIDPEMLVGTWQATRPDGAQFELTLKKPDKFSWSFTPQNQPAQKFDGTYTVEKNVLALEGEKVGSLIGEVTPGNGKTFNFKILGAPSDDPGLTFKQ
jgi:tetratricopeptide (TPR) repeat protein